jgi:hypothetical protein
MTREHDCHVLAADALFRHGQWVPVRDPLVGDQPFGGRSIALGAVDGSC